MYVADERFKNNIDKHVDGMAAFICDAIDVYCHKEKLNCLTKCGGLVKKCENARKICKETAHDIVCIEKTVNARYNYIHIKGG